MVIRHHHQLIRILCHFLIFHTESQDRASGTEDRFICPESRGGPGPLIGPRFLGGCPRFFWGTPLVLSAFLSGKPRPRAVLAASANTSSFGSSSQEAEQAIPPPATTVHWFLRQSWIVVAGGRKTSLNFGHIPEIIFFKKVFLFVGDCVRLFRFVGKTVLAWPIGKMDRTILE